MKCTLLTTWPRGQGIKPASSQEQGWWVEGKVPPPQATRPEDERGAPTLVQGEKDIWAGQGRAADPRTDTEHAAPRDAPQTGFKSSMCHYIYRCGQESLRRNGGPLKVNKSPKCSTWVQSQKWQNELSSFPRQPFNITVIQVYAPTTKAEEAEQFYEDLQDLLELTPKTKKQKKHVLFIWGDRNAKQEVKRLLFLCKAFSSCQITSHEPSLLLSESYSKAGRALLLTLSK